MSGPCYRLRPLLLPLWHSWLNFNSLCVAVRTAEVPCTGLQWASTCQVSPERNWRLPLPSNHLLSTASKGASSSHLHHGVGPPPLVQVCRTGQGWVGTDPCPAPSSPVPMPAPAHSPPRVPQHAAPCSHEGTPTLGDTEHPDVLPRLFGQHHSFAGGELWSNNAANRKWFTSFLHTSQAIFVLQQMHHLILPYKVLIKLATKKHHFFVFNFEELQMATLPDIACIELFTATQRLILH